MSKKLWIHNAVILSDDGKMVRYRPKCPQCGFVPTNITCGCCVVEAQAAMHEAECQKCHHTIEVMIGRSEETI